MMSKHEGRSPVRQNEERQAWRQPSFLVLNVSCCDPVFVLFPSSHMLYTRHDKNDDSTCLSNGNNGVHQDYSPKSKETAMLQKNPYQLEILWTADKLALSEITI